MELYKPAEPVEIFRLTVRRQGEKNIHLSVHKTTAEKIKDELKNILAPHVDPFAEGKKTGIDIRRAMGAENLEATSISFTGLSVQETFDIIMDYLNKKK